MVVEIRAPWEPAGAIVSTPMHPGPSWRDLHRKLSFKFYGQDNWHVTYSDEIDTYSCLRFLVAYRCIYLYIYTHMHTLVAWDFWHAAFSNVSQQPCTKRGMAAIPNQETQENRYPFKPKHLHGVSTTRHPRSRSKHCKHVWDYVFSSSSLPSLATGCCASALFATGPTSGPVRMEGSQRMVKGFKGIIVNLFESNFPDPNLTGQIMMDHSWFH